MWSSLVVDFESDEDLEGGCILAHHMGLGKVRAPVLLALHSVLNPHPQACVHQLGGPQPAPCPSPSNSNQCVQLVKPQLCHRAFPK